MVRQPTSGSSSSISSSPPGAGPPGPSPLGLKKEIHETWIDHLALLLHAAAGVEHELMIQYLYAAYSLGGIQVPEDQRDMVREWRRNLLAIAKEEMGHFLTVQNILTVLGAPILWTRGNHPYDDRFFPLRKFELSPFTMDSLSCYLYAEAPAKTAAVVHRYFDMDPKEVARIIERVRKELGVTPHRVEELYAKIVSIIKNPKLIPDSAFHPETYAVQASWEEWGKGYKPYAVDPESSIFQSWAPVRPPGPAPLSSFPFPATAAQARVILPQVASRTQVLDALHLIGEQGEATSFEPDDDQPSHFDRFLSIYAKFENISWKPARDVPNNPTTIKGRPDATYIESEYSRDWAHLFNLRYRMLLTYISHMYRLPPATDSAQPQMRPGTLHRVFGEMYNLRAIAGILVRLPLTNDRNDPRRAGAPFELPYTLVLPDSDDDCWRLHRELLVNSALLCNRLLPGAPIDGTEYLSALRDLDRQSIAWIDAVLQGPGSMWRSRA